MRWRNDSPPHTHTFALHVLLERRAVLEDFGQGEDPRRRLARREALEEHPLLLRRLQQAVMASNRA